MLENDERARVQVERFYRTEDPTMTVLWATATKAYVFCIGKRVEERNNRKVPVHYAIRISWRVALAYDVVRPEQDPREKEGPTLEGARAHLRRLFLDIY
ncbi:MAG: hypothetical protein M3R38_31660 [Actinomycetota bacterium]|nr:hypothetical protein [Actinomycetota bacterium]